MRVAGRDQADPGAAGQAGQVEGEAGVVGEAGALDLHPGVRRAEDVAQRAEGGAGARLVPREERRRDCAAPATALPPTALPPTAP